MLIHDLDHNTNHTQSQVEPNIVPPRSRKGGVRKREDEDDESKVNPEQDMKGEVKDGSDGESEDKENGAGEEADVRDVIYKLENLGRCFETYQF